MDREDSKGTNAITWTETFLVLDTLGQSSMWSRCVHNPSNRPIKERSDQVASYARTLCVRVCTA
ncbi:hypothetical protein FOMPIDRAFT_1023645 [Fomitopsis schrenkii]|uniref:Uncharacterized protein n=1 Tax=Fomitopsis schrenkii TaxID=2126942 RepID=S8E7W2_FOMSC|nr:hypothetical protein FOMPIDRAFT_1023645 [Fomitopsis schrenkii]